MISITRQMTIGYALAVTAGVAVALAAGRWLLEREMIGGLRALHEIELKEIVAGLGQHSDELSRAELIERMKEHSEADADLFFFQVHDGKGQILFRSATLGNAILPDLSVGGNNWTVDIPPFGRVHTSELAWGGLHFQVASRLAPAEKVLRRYTQISLLIAGIVAAGSLGLGYGISRLALRPIRAIERTARRITADNLGERIPAPPGRDEVAELARLLNAMFDRLEAAFREIRQFSADASHELKTPLTLIRLNAEQLRKLAGDHPAMTAAADDLLEEIGRMNQVIERLLFLARAESGVLPVARRRRDTGSFFKELAEDAAVLAEDRGLRLTVAINEPGEADFDPGMMRQLVFNLVSNAVKASPSGGTIALRSVHPAGLWRVEVEDEGPGVPPERQEQIFGRFVQLGQSEGATAGHGLGLAICRGIAHLHQGEVTIANRTDRAGLRAVVELPAPAAG